jgi:glycosyl-4,4'-diaponeurosporenoate acyltransferase
MKSLLLLVLIDSLIWILYSVIVGFSVTKLSIDSLRKFTLLDYGLMRTKALCETLKIKKWKDRVPEAGSMFKGGVSKRQLIGIANHDLERFAMETKRAEVAHYLFLLFSPVFFLFNPFFLGLAMVIYAIVANIPCILIQRYNRARIYSIIDN